MTPWARLQTYAGNPDPATAMANTVGMIVGWNAPFYPLYVAYIAGVTLAGPVLLTAASTPFFLAIPAVARRSSKAGRFALPVIGTLNTMWCTKVLGASCGLELFLIPCVLLSALLHRAGERRWLLTAASLAIAANLVPADWFGSPIIDLPGAAAHHLATLNECSVLLLCFILAWNFATLTRA